MHTRPRSLFYKPFNGSNLQVVWQIYVLDTSRHYHPSLIFSSHLRLQALVAIIRLGWKWLALTNALAYNAAVRVTDLKCFIEQSRRYPYLDYCYYYDVSM